MAVNEHTLVLFKTDPRRKLSQSERLETSGSYSKYAHFMLKYCLKSLKIQYIIYWSMTSVIIVN